MGELFDFVVLIVSAKQEGAFDAGFGVLVRDDGVATQQFILPCFAQSTPSPTFLRNCLNPSLLEPSLRKQHGFVAREDQSMDCRARAK